MHVVEQSSHLVQLAAVRSENLGRAREVVDDGDGKDFDAHLLLNLLAHALIFVGLVELGDCVVVLVRVLPPLRAQLTHIAEAGFLQVVGKRRQLLIDLDQVLQVKLHVLVQLLALLTCLLSITRSGKALEVVGLGDFSVFSLVLLVHLFNLGLVVAA